MTSVVETKAFSLHCVTVACEIHLRQDFTLHHCLAFSHWVIKF